MLRRVAVVHVCVREVDMWGSGIPRPFVLFDIKFLMLRRSVFGFECGDLVTLPSISANQNGEMMSAAFSVPIIISLSFSLRLFSAAWRSLEKKCLPPKGHWSLSRRIQVHHGGQIARNADCQDYQIKPEANVAAPDTSTWPLLLKVRFPLFFLFFPAGSLTL